MRPDAASNAAQIRSRKSSLAEQSTPLTDLRNATPTSFTLRRGSDHAVQDSLDGPARSQSRQETQKVATELAKSASPTTEETGLADLGRRRSTIKGPRQRSSRRNSSAEDASQMFPQDSTPLTPLLPPSQHTSAPGSPKSTSTRSLRKSDEESIADETGSQAVASSGEDEAEAPSMLMDSAPQLIMPSIKMPSRRPFTQRGKSIGRLKVLIAGNQGMKPPKVQRYHEIANEVIGTGKTSLIKSIVQLCEDIVHVDPLTSSISSVSASSAGRPRDKARSNRSATTEVYASTKPYPSWWTDMEDSKILRRRKSMGDAVLERNVCFVDVSSSTGIEPIVEYMAQQLQSGMMSASSASGDFLGLLSGRGGAQVDVILYLLSNGKTRIAAIVEAVDDGLDTLQEDCERIRQLSEMGNVVPLISKADIRTPDETAELKSNSLATAVSALPKLPVFEAAESSEVNISATSPYTVSSTPGPDTETMDASLLMSPEYVQPLLPSELALLVRQIFETDVVAYLRHSAAKKLIAWHTLHPQMSRLQTPAASYHAQSTPGSPNPSSLSNSGVLVTLGSDLSLTTSNSYALARLADHTQREERLAQVRLSKWASDLQISLQRERERYERLTRGERATWLVEKIGEEVRNGRVVAVDNSGALIKSDAVEAAPHYRLVSYATHDPLGLLRWNETMKTRGWVVVQVVSSFGVIGGLALWLAKTWGFTSSLHEWAEGWSCRWLGHD